MNWQHCRISWEMQGGLSLLEIKKALESVFEKAYVKAENGEAEPVAFTRGLRP
jgi:hypothetical protein